MTTGANAQAAKRVAPADAEVSESVNHAICHPTKQTAAEIAATRATQTQRLNRIPTRVATTSERPSTKRNHTAR
jgi:hypothetical protein